MTEQAKSGSKVSGEGNYEAAKQFDEAEAAFVKNRGNEIPGLAKSAADALDGPEGEDLRKASEAAAKGQTPDKSPK
ncbi:MAG: hypothetical protein ABIM50_08730 [Novosphingobium sp.]